MYQCTDVSLSARVTSLLKYSHYKNQLSLILLTKPKWEQVSFCSGFAIRQLPWETCPIKQGTIRAKEIKDCHWSYWTSTRQNHKTHLLKEETATSPSIEYSYFFIWPSWIFRAQVTWYHLVRKDWLQRNHLLPIKSSRDSSTTSPAVKL